MLTSYFRLIYNRASHESLFLSLCDVSSPSHEFLITVPGFLRSSHLYQGKILFYFAHFCPFYVTHIWCSVLKSCLSLEIPRTPGFLVVTISWCAVYLVAAVCSNSCSLSRWCYLTTSSCCFQNKRGLTWLCQPPQSVPTVAWSLRKSHSQKIHSTTDLSGL